MDLSDVVGGLVGGSSGGESDEPLAGDGDDLGSEFDGLGGDVLGGDGEFGGLGGDDLGGDGLGGDGLGGDGELGGLGGDDLGGDGEFDELVGGDGRAAVDLEPRLDELEGEIERISSTMGTVRSENESISETVDDIEDNIRKLLEIYEMVTRGVNPFVDGAEEGASVGEGFSLFDGGDSAEEVPDDLDPELAEADADSFFDDDWDDGHEGGDLDADEPDGVEDVAEDALAPDDGEGKTFEELKTEYEDGGGDWTDVDASSASPGPAEAGGDLGDEPDPGLDDGPVPGVVAGSNEGEEPEPPAESSDEPADGKPYLAELPHGYGTDLLVIEWLSFLRSCSSTPEALRAIRYYETIGWVGPSAADDLTQYLSGLGGREPGSVSGGATQLTIDHHTRSLGYIGKLGGAEVHTERLEWAEPSSAGARQRGTQRGIQR